MRQRSVHILGDSRTKHNFTHEDEERNCDEQDVDAVLPCHLASAM